MKKLKLYSWARCSPWPPAARRGNGAEARRAGQANAQKDSLMQEVAISSRLISDVTRARQAKIRNNRLHVRVKARSRRRTTPCSPGCGTS